ncbi:redoxin domain-containing protein [Membranicola marinus]|uniref:Redoxin domain-containing protein n=1 Tax=Membranihabitans marinus TaxID=1227546 RepID=A0A953HVY8_9BACT|nr:redoxin domain-containing protein [Membranihabitans marinus]MBY5959245.1 redoxin domain-containing protein [Membranihabitans marinus]
MKNLIYGLIGLFALGGTAAAGVFLSDEIQDAEYKIGETIENFSLKNLNGEEVAFSESTGSLGTILIFTCNTCPYAKLYEERILQLHDVYNDVGYTVILINPSNPDLKPGDHPSELMKWVSQSGYSGLYLIDSIGLFRRFGARKTPEVFLMDKSNVLKYRGAIDNSAQGAESVTDKYLENAIRALQDGVDPEPVKTRPVGCVIKH